MNNSNQKRENNKYKTGRQKKKPAITKNKNWILHFYIAGKTSKSIAALNNLQIICEEKLKGKYSIEVIDLLKNPKLARSNQILAIPTLVRKLPEPVKCIIGDLSNTEKVLVGLELIEDGAFVQNGNYNFT